MTLAQREIIAFSPDGKWAVSSLNGSLELISLDGGQNIIFEASDDLSEYYSQSTGNILSDTGILLASNSEDNVASYYKEAVWKGT